MAKVRTHERPRPALVSLLVAIATFALLWGMISMGISPERYDIKVGEVAKLTITASKDVEDTVTTEKLRDEAERAVSPSYNSDASVMPEVMENLDAVLAQIRELPGLLKGMDGTTLDQATDSMITQAQSMLTFPWSDENSAQPSAGAIRTLIEADAETLSLLTNEVSRLVRETLNGKLLEGQESEAIEKLKRDLIGEGFDRQLVESIGQVAGSCMRANMLLDEETTRINREKARDEVDPVIYKKGQNIIRAGEVVTENQIQMLNSLGMLKDRSVDVSLYLGIAMLLILLGTVIGVYLFTFERDILNDPAKITLLCVICVLVAVFSMLVRPISSYLMPVMLGAMLTTLLLKSRLAIVTNLVLSVLTGLLASVDSGMFSSTMFSIMLTSFISGTVCVVVIRSRKQRLSVLLSGVVSSAASAACTAAVALINSANLQNMLNWIGFAAASGLLSAVLCIGLQSVLEWVFNLDTNAKLMDLSNPNQPLLKRLMIEAPGTYHHSIIVANLSEAAANAIGANGLLARVGAYYHDIGKLKRPLYFKENQIHDNPHDRTDPLVSTAILTSHPRDGVEMAQKARLPAAIQEIILQHHGDTPVLYFYDKAVKQGGEVDIQDFRYDGPRPQKPESAIVMLADTIEAAARTMTDSTPEKLSQLIQRLVRSKLEDGQLDRCSLTFRDLNLISEAFLTVLGGVYHERIEYPEVPIPERKRLDESVCECQAEENGKPDEQPAPDAPHEEPAVDNNAQPTIDEA